jgi:nucleotide-binding universal stress UspA family protein
MSHRSKFLVIVDDSVELNIAIQFAARRASNTKGGLVLLSVIEYADTQQWKSVEDIIHQESRAEAEKKLQEWSEVAFNISGNTPEIVIKEGVVSEEIIKFINEDKKIRFLVLAASDQDNPGPLVSLLAGQRSGKLPVPTVVIPAGLSSEEIIKFINEDKKIRFLVLAASDQDNPGPLVSLLAGQRSGKLPVPTVVIPAGLSSEEIDDLASRAQ